MEAMNPYQFYQREAPEAAAAFDGLIGALATPDGMDAKTMQLIYIGIKASQSDPGAVAAHVPMAKAAGATRAEIKGAILLTLTVSGVSGVLSCLQPSLNMYENC